jgi:diadenosine tetraphosphate (Ap4A) HIT family hydrolase
MESATCPFCDVSSEEIVIHNEQWFARWDKYPVSPGHLLLIPLRHVSNYFDTTPQEKQSLLQILDESKHVLDMKYHPDGYNIGINIGAVAGQTIMHLHVHVIPRYQDDMAHPEGGVRGVIPSKQTYQKREN